MQKSAFFNSKNGDRMYKAEDWAEYFASFIGNGVFPNPSGSLQVQEGLDMRVIVRPGKAWINGYFFQNQGDYVITIDGADGILNRIDRLVIRWSAIDREIIIAVKKGNFSVAPSALDLRRDADVYELALADIVVNSGVISISQANITDLRLNKELCGIVKGTVEEVDTTTIFNQFQNFFNTFTTEETAKFKVWAESVKEVLDDNTAFQLLNLIEGKQDTITATGLLKGDGEGGVVAAEPGVDYPTIETVAALQEAVGSGGGSAIIAPGYVFEDLEFYISNATGNDANDGTTTATAWKTIQRVVDELNRNHTYFGKVNIYITSTADYAHHFIMEGKYFRHIRIEGTATPTANLYVPRFKFTNCPGFIEIHTVCAYLIEFEKVSNAYVNRCTLNRMRSSGVTATECPSVLVSGCSIMGQSSAIQTYHNTIIYSRSNSGTGNDYGLSARGGIIFKEGSQPSGTTSSEHKLYGGQIWG